MRTAAIIVIACGLAVLPAWALYRHSPGVRRVVAAVWDAARPVDPVANDPAPTVVENMPVVVLPGGIDVLSTMGLTHGVEQLPCEPLHTGEVCWTVPLWRW